MPSIDGYADLTPIGSGGSAVVFRARATRFDRDVAIKLLARDSVDGAGRRHFDREARVMGALSDHPHIVTVYDAGITETELPYLVMEYLPNGSLADQLATRGPLPWEEVIAIGVKLAGALAAAHRAGVLHRDVKPENVFVSAYGEPELGDFGIARRHATDTRSNDIHLSVPYAAPEIVAGEEPTERSDVYSLAATLFALVWGTPPFFRGGEDSVIPQLVRITHEPVPNLRPLGVPGPVATVIERSLEKAPEERASAAELAEDLRRAQREVGLDPTPVAMARVEPDIDLTREDQPRPEVSPTPPPPGLPTSHTSKLTPRPIPASDRSRRAPTRSLLVGAVALALALIAVSGVALARRNDRPPAALADPASTSISAPATTVAAAVPSTTTPPAITLPTKLRAPIAAGHYRTSALGIPIEFTLGPGWRSSLGESREIVDFNREGLPGSDLFSLLAVDNVLDPARTYARRSEVGAASAHQPVPSDLAGWLAAHPRLKVSPVLPVRLGSLQGVRIDVEVTAGYTYVEPNSVVLFHLGAQRGFYFLGKNVNRLYILGVGNRTLIAAVEASAPNFPAMAGAAEQVLASIRTV